MNKEEVMKYVESHPNSRFHITTFEPIGKLQQQKIIPKHITRPLSGEITIYKTVDETIFLDDFIAYVIRESMSVDRDFLPIVLDQPHYTESARNFTSVAYSNISSIEAV